VDRSLLVKRLWTAAQWLFGAAVLVWLVVMITDQWEDIRAVEIVIHPGFLVVAVLALSLFYLVYVLSWNRILAWLRGGKEGWPALIQARIFFLSILTRYLPAGKVVNVGSRIELYHRQGGRRATAFAAVLIEQLFFMGGAVLLLWLALVFEHDISLPGQIADMRGWLTLGGAFVFIMLLFFDRLLRIVVQRLRFSQFEGLHIRLGWGQKAELLVRFAGVNLFQGLAAYTFFRAVSSHPASDPSFIFYAVTAYPLSRLIGQLVAFIPGGLGVREGTYALLLQAYAPVGILLVVGAVVRLTSMLLELTIVSGLILATRAGKRSA
jgi:uncharacterized membrane protein YbhN (UPF0104 family)